MKLYSPDVTKPTEVNYYWHAKVLVEPMPKPKEGEWLPKKFPYDWYYPTCSVCGFENKGELDNYCPNCGANMKSESVSNDKAMLENLLNEIKEILTFYSFDVPMVYGDGEETVEKAVLLEEVEHTIRCILNDFNDE